MTPALPQREGVVGTFGGTFYLCFVTDMDDPKSAEVVMAIRDHAVTFFRTPVQY